MVRRLAKSDPPEGSVIASAAIFAPERISGSTRPFSAALPACMIGGAPMVCENSEALTPPQPARATSSATIT